MSSQNKITAWLENAHGFVFSAYAIIAAFSAYFCMYAYRQPFTVATYEGVAAFSWMPEINYKILLIITQVFGYTISKFAGIKFVSEMNPARRAATILGTIGFSWLMLLFFGLVPPPYNFVFMFFNGLSLGVVWGLVFGFLEGRRFSEVLGAGLSASFIVASGFVKSIGKVILDSGISEFWMPFITGLIFIPLLLFFVWMLKQLPPPSQKDELLRTKRQPMHAKERWEFFKMFAPALVLLTILYMFLSAYRDFRDKFAREIWDALGYSHEPDIFTKSEIPIAIGVLIVLGLVMWVRNNRYAMYAIHLIMFAGALLIGLSTLGFQAGIVNPAAWMVLVGLGLYLGYVPFNCILFDRMIAATGFVGTAGFMIYVADSFGYLASVGLLLYKNFGHPNLPWIDFFINASYITAAFCSVFFIVSLLLMRGKFRNSR